MGGRNKDSRRLTKKEKIAQENGLIVIKQGITSGNLTRTGRPEQNYGPRRTGLDTGSSARSRSTESIVHATLFCVLVAIIVSWALGY